MENIHVLGLSKLYNELIEEINKNNLLDLEEEKHFAKNVMLKMVELEDNFIDLVFDSANNKIKGLTRDEVKQYIRYIADIRLKQINIEPFYNLESNPLDWMEVLLESVSHVNFFELRSTDYAKGAINWDLENVRF